MSKAKKTTVKTNDKASTKATVAVPVLPNKRAQVIAIVLFCRQAKIALQYVPGLVFKFTSIMARSHAEGDINNKLPECRNYVNCYVKGRYTANANALAMGETWVKTLGITETVAKRASADYTAAIVEAKKARK